MFRIPSAYKCEKCDSKTYSNADEPICQKCFSDFIRIHVPVMVRDKDAPPYNPNDSIAYC